jgi:hypothetical protein
MMIDRILTACVLATVVGAQDAPEVTLRPGRERVDVCVYGASAAGVVAAVQARRDGMSVVLLDCDRWLGGLTTSGLGATDVGSEAAIGGLSREFYARLQRHYARDEAWHLVPKKAFKGRGHHETPDAVWTFEPKVAQRVLQAMLNEVDVVALPRRLDRSEGGVVRDGARITSLRCEDGHVVEARVFVDCSYEGDLLAAAGCTFVVGREANTTYGETLNGVQRQNAKYHQFTAEVDPYVVPGDPSSGLLPGIAASPPGADGEADRGVQAYCFRICATDVEVNRVPWPKPADYDVRDYEVLLRHFEAGSTLAPWHPVSMPNGKTDSNNNGAFSTDFIGGNHDWPTADYATRERLRHAHRRYQQGLFWTLAHDERVPAKVRAEFQRYGLARDEFAHNDHWPPLLYVREGRRLVGLAVVTEHHCMARTVADDPVGLGAYAMDSHNVWRYVDEQGHVRNEGDVQVRVPKPYGIPYGALVPQRGEADNLLVPVAASASHIAYGSVRMEPVFMVLAQSAAVAAKLAIDGDRAVQDVPYPELRERLLAVGQVLAAKH